MRPAPVNQARPTGMHGSAIGFAIGCAWLASHEPSLLDIGTEHRRSETRNTPAPSVLRSVSAARFLPLGSAARAQSYLLNTSAKNLVASASASLFTFAS